MSEPARPRDAGEQRTLIAIAMCMVVFWGWSNWFAPKVDPALVDGQPSAESAPVLPAAPAVVASAPIVDQPCSDTREVFATSTFSMAVSDCGAVRSIDLPGVQAPVIVTPWWTWLFAKAGTFTGSADPGPWVPYRSGGAHETLLGPNGQFLGAGRGALGLPSLGHADVVRSGDSVSWARTEGGLKVTSTLSPGESSDLANLTIQWESDRPLVGPFWVLGEDALLPVETAEAMQPRLEAGAAGELDTLLAPQDVGASQPVGEGPADWFGVGDRYFLAAAKPLSGTSGSVQYAALPGASAEDVASGRFRVGVYFLSDATDIGPGKPLVQNFQIYVGAKKSERLSEIGGGLESGVSLGWFALFAKVILFTLQLFGNVISNWGLCIIALTFLIRASLFPLAAKGFKSGKQMQEVQPKLKELQTLYPDDKEKQSAETMRIMREHGVNPLAGCLPIIPQMLVFWALASALAASPDLYGAEFLYLQDLSMQDPYGVLAVLIIAGMYAQQQLMPMTGIDPTQAQMMKAMPLIFGFLMFNYPSGMSVYYVVNTVLMILQQWYIMRDGGTIAPSLPI
ncbi:MAG: membrane protein insertase YidC [Myxococcales bacterium]|nr:membrane protein insertase YidC [Myxococcales bacterium]